MSKGKVKKLILMGIGCAVLLGAAIVYAVLYNHSRLVEPMTMSEYVFSVKDIPMLAAGAVLFLYIIYLIISIFKAALHSKNAAANHTRKLSPYLGFFGFFGFFGLLGFWTYHVQGIIYPFIFFTFFGFFGFFYEGKLSDVLKDELYRENERKAELQAYKTGFVLLFIVIWLIGMGTLSRNVEWCAIFMLIAMSLIYALVLFLSRYLLYRYEKEE